MKNISGIAILSTGFTGIDNLLNGIHPGNLIVVASRPGVGKTSFALSILKNFLIVSEKAALIFSIETPADQLALRILACEVKEDINILKGGDFNNDKSKNFFEAVDKLSGKQIFIDDAPLQSIAQIKEKANATNIKASLGLIIIDYLQLINRDLSASRHEQLENIVLEIKQMALELKCPVLLLTMLMNNENKNPQLSDLDRIGSIGQVADIVMFLQKTGSFVHDITAHELINVVVAKSCNYKTGSAHLVLKKECYCFEDSNQLI